VACRDQTFGEDLIGSLLRNPPKEFIEKELKEVKLRRKGLDEYVAELEGMLE